MGKHQIFSIFILRQFPYKMSFMRFLKPIWPKSYGFYSNKDQKEANLRFVSCFSLCNTPFWHLRTFVRNRVWLESPNDHNVRMLGQQIKNNMETIVYKRKTTTDRWYKRLGWGHNLRTESLINTNTSDEVMIWGRKRIIIIIIIITRYDYNLTIMKSPKPATDNRFKK
jgi:hypothetical protein